MSPSLVTITPCPSPYCVPSGRTNVQYVPVSLMSTPNIEPLASNELSIFGPPPRFGNTRCPVIRPDIPPIFSPNIMWSSLLILSQVNKDRRELSIPRFCGRLLNPDRIPQPKQLRWYCSHFVQLRCSCRAAGLQ